MNLAPSLCTHRSRIYGLLTSRLHCVFINDDSILIHVTYITLVMCCYCGNIAVIIVTYSVGYYFSKQSMCLSLIVLSIDDHD